MSKIIIHNESSVSGDLALRCVLQVIREGRVSNYGKQYCYVTTFESPDVFVYTGLNRKSDVFYVKDNHDPN